VFSIDLLADLPPPRDDEPPSLRADIADELVDHLQCAYRREMLKDGDDESAQQRVLDRFGDPKKLARRLWWQSMWSRMMGKWILSGLQWLVSLVAVVLVGAVLWQQSQMLAELRTAKQEEQSQRQALTAALDQLRAQSVSPRVSPYAAGAPIPMDGEAVYEPPRIYEAPRIQGNSDPDGLPDLDGPYVGGIPPAPPDPQVAPADERRSLTVRFVLEKDDGPPVSPEKVSLNGNPGSWTGTAEDERHIPLYDNHDVIFRSLEPGRYELKIRLADGQHCTRPVLIRDDSPHELTIVCPSPREKATVLVSMPPLPADLHDAASEVNYWIQPQSLVLGELAWQPPSDDYQVLSFDPKTGKAISLRQYSGNNIPDEPVRTDLSKMKAEDCVVFVAAGTVGIRYSIGLHGQAAAPGHWIVEFPPQDSSFMPRTLEPGNNHWNVELPDEFVADARQRLQQLLSANDNDRLPPPPSDLPPANAKPPQLVVKVVQEKADGPPASVDSVLIQGAGLEKGADEEWLSPLNQNQKQFVFGSLVPDQYQLTITLADTQKCIRPILIRDEKPRELTMICPGPRNKVPVSITIKPLPEKLQKQKFNVELSLWPGPVEIGGAKWTIQNLSHQKVTFDTQTGLPTAIEVGNQHLDLRDLPADERSVFLPVGTVCCQFEAHKRLEEPGGVPVYEWPRSFGEGESALKHTITVEETAWEIELPQAYLDEMLNGDKAADRR